jgi:hypothetical protein
MTEAAYVGGAVSQAVEADLRKKVGRHGIVVWLDSDGQYTGLVDRLSEARSRGGLPYDVVGYRGSYLELLLRLEPLAGGVTKRPLVLHLPGLSEQSIKDTPMLELYLSGTRFRKALDTALTDAAAGRIRPEQIDAYRGQGSLTLDDADSWVEARLLDAEGGIGAQLRAMSFPMLVDDLLREGGGLVANQLVESSDYDALWERLATLSGAPDAWRTELMSAAENQAVEDMTFAVAGWALAVEYVDDLVREPVNELIASAKGLPRPVIDGCRELAQHLRERHPKFYQRTADETEALLEDEISAAKAEDLGKIDTFRFEEQKVLHAALAALEDRQWKTAAEWATLRLNGKSFWLQENPARNSAWQLVAGAAALGLAIDAAGAKLAAKSHEEAVARYKDAAAAVDQAHRHLEQRRLELLYSILPEFDVLRARLDVMRLVWREWADQWALDFNKLCRDEGFLPPSELQQRNLFDDVVRPLCREPGPTALFVVDAFRYEMGAELHDALHEALKRTPAATVSLDARLAELPTVTEVGMNVLAPVARDGRLRPAMTGGRIKGFSTGEFRVSNPNTRQRAKQERVGGDTCPWLTLEKVVGDGANLKQTISRAKLVVVHSLEIDSAGEQGAGPAVFGPVMQKLRAAWRLLRDAGVKRFVFTADHGFLLLDDQSPAAQSHGRKIDPKRRHVFSEVGADHSGEARVALADLKYDEVSGHVMFPETTAVFDTGNRSMSFVHGGNSLQERVIPVVTVVHRSAAGATTVRYTVTAAALEGVAGMHCFSGKVEVAAQTTLDFGGSKEVELALRVPNAPDLVVELCQTRGGARLKRSSLYVAVGSEFEVFFRLSGNSDARASVELFHPSAVVEVTPFVLDQRFAVTPTRQATGTASQPAPAPAESASEDWLTQLPEGGVRQLFQHLATHGAVTEAEAAGMLGGQRGLRRFARQFEALAARAPFDVRILVVAGVKRYVREGSV